MSENFIGRKVLYWVWVEGTRWAWTKQDIVSWFEKTDSDFQDKFELGEDNWSSWSIVAWSDVYKKEEYASWKIEWNLKMNNITSFLYALMWDKVVTDNWDGTYTHTFSLLETNTHKSLVIWKINPVEKMLYKLAMISSFEIVAEIWEITKVIITLESKKWEPEETLTANFKKDHNLLSRFWILKIANNIWWLLNVEPMNLRSFRINFNKNTERRWSLWDVSPVEILNKTFDITWTIEFDYKDNVVKDLVMSTEKKALSFLIKDTEKTIWTWTKNPFLGIILHRVWFTSYEIMEGNDDVVIQSVNFRWLYNFWTKQTATIQLLNTLNV